MKTFKKLIVPIIIMVVLLIVVLVWAIVNNKDKNTSVPSNEAVLSMASYDVKTLTVHNNKTDYEIGFSSEHVDDIQIWSMMGKENEEDFELDQEKVASYVSFLCTFTSQDRVAEDPTDLAQYGLNPAEYTITITDYSGNVTQILMGNVLASGSYAYFMKAGDNKVYTVAAIKHSFCGYTEIDFVNSKILNLNYGEINNIEFIRKTDGLDIISNCVPAVGYDTAQYNIVSPFVTDSSNVYSNMIDSIIALNEAKYVILTDEEVKQYGLDDPAYTFIFTMHSGEQVTIQFSDVVSKGMYYGKSSTTDQYFMVSDQQVTGFDSPIMTLIGEWICYKPISEVKEINCTAEDKEWTLTLSVPNAISDPDAKAELNMRNALVKTPDGSRTYAAILYEAVATIAIGGVDFDATPDINNVFMTITMINNNNNQTVYKFVPRDSNSYYVVVNDQYSCFYIYADELFAYGRDNTYSYGVWPAYELLRYAIDKQSNGTFDIMDFCEAYEAAA